MNAAQPLRASDQKGSLRRLCSVLLAALLGVAAFSIVTPAAEAVTPAPDHLVIAAVWGANSDTAQWTNDWIELYNPTDQDISLGTVAGGAFTSNNFSLCYRAVAASPQKCSSTVKLSGTVKAHHYFFVWYANAHTPADAGTYPSGVTPDLDASVKSAANGQQAGSNMGGCNTGGQVLLLNPNASGAANAATFVGDLSSADAKTDGLVDGVGWTNANTSQPNAAETNGATAINGFAAGTVNACVIARNFTDGVPVDTDVNKTDFSIASPATFAIHSQISDHVAVASISDTVISINEAMTPIQVKGTKGTGALSYVATGLPDGVSIDPATGAISGTPKATDDLKAYPVTVTVTDSSPTGAESASTGFNLTVSNLLRVDAVANASVHKGAALPPIQVNAHGGAPGYSYAATGLPAGVSIDPSTGIISGTPTAAVGHYAAHVTVTDGGAGAAAQTASVNFTLLVQPKTTGPGGSDPLVGLRINEVKTTGTPANDFVELYNTGAAVTGASVNLVNSNGDSYTVPTQNIAAGGYVVVDGADLHTAGVDLAAKDTLDLTESDDSLLDETSWTSNIATSWGRFPDGTGVFGASSKATKGATNAAPGSLTQNDLIVAGVYGADGTTFNADWVQLYNPTDHDISLGTIDPTTGVVTPNYYQCYRANAGTTCSSMKLYGTVLPHHFFLIWNGHNADTTVDAHSKGVPPAGITPDLDFRYGSNDTNSAATKAANDPSGQTNNGFGGCSTGGQLWLLNAASNGVAPTGNLATPANKATIVDGVGWTATGVTQPSGFETAGLNSGTNNACVIARTFKFGLPLDADNNSTDFTTVDPASFTLHSQASTTAAITPIADTEISLNEAMTPIQVQATKIFHDLTYAATGLPDGITIDPATGVISGTPVSTDAIQDYPVTVTVTDGVPSDTATASFTLKLSKILRLDPLADVSLNKGVALTAIHAAAHGGTPAYTYAATGLPTGVTIDQATGVISGTPTGPTGRTTVHVTVTDSGVGDAKASVSRDFTFVELPPLGGPASGDPLAGLTINEIKATGKAANDWVELYNTGDAVHTALTLVDTEGDTYAVPAQDIASHGFAVIDGPALAAAGFDLAASDTVYLTETDGTVLDKTSFTSYPPTTWARTTDGAGSFAVSAFPTKGAANSGAPVIGANDLLVSEVNYDNNSTDWYEYSELTNTTDHPIDFAAYGLTLTKSGAVMTLHDPSDTTQTSPTIDPVIPAHGTRIIWWVENQYFGVKTTAQFLSNYGLPQSTPVILAYGFSSMANSGGDHSFYISVNKGSSPITQAWVDTPCAANTFNGSSVCTASNNNYAEHYAVPSDRSNPLADVWYNSLFAGGDDINHALKQKLSTPTSIDLEQVGFTRAVKITSVTSAAVKLHNTAGAPVDLSGYVLQKNGAGTGYTLPGGTALGSGDDLIVASSDSGLSFADRDYVTLLAPRGYSYSDAVGIADTTGPLLKTLSYDASSGSDPVIDPTTGLPLPPAGGLYRPAGISAHNGTVYVSNTGDNLLATMVNGANTILAGSLAGYGELGNEGPATDAQLYQPGGTALDSHGNVYIADSGDNVIRVISTDGKIHRFAGTGTAGGAGSAVTATSTPLSVNLWHPNDVAVDGDDNVFVADTSDNRVLEITAGGTIKVIAGTGKAGYTGDGSAGIVARLSQPAGVAVDAKDNVYIADSSNNVVRRVDGVTGLITTVAGDYAAGLSGNKDCLGGFAGDGGPATSALLNDPQGIAVDGAGDLFIADTFNNAIREVLPNGTITTVVNASAVAGAGNASPVGNGSLPATTSLNTPYAVAVDPVTNAVYIADTKNSVVDQVINAAEGGSTAGPIEPAEQVAITGSGVAASACAALANGPVVVADGPTITGTLAPGAVLTANPGTWNPVPDLYHYQWLRDGVAINGATESTYTVTGDDVTHGLSVAVTAIKEDFASASATSAAVTIPVPLPGTLTKATPTITGTVKVGGKVTAKPGSWKAGSAAVTSFSYQWLRNGVAISKATASTYTVTPADYGKKLSVTVTGSHAGYGTASVSSAAHAVARGTLTTAAPTIAGKAKVGTRLTAKRGTWKAGALVLSGGSHIHYQWFVNGHKITGATNATFWVAQKYKGKKVTVKVTGLATGYTTVTRSSAATSPVQHR